MDRLIVFFRHPCRGAKTRLAADLGDAGAALLYAAMLADLAEALSPIQRMLFPMAAPRRAGTRGSHPPLAAPWRSAPKQRGTTLPARMVAAFRCVFAAGATRAVLVGSDIPRLTAERARAAFDALRTADAVLGPSDDGGYYLVGFTAGAFPAAPLLYADTDPVTAFARTHAGLREAGLSVTVQETLGDIDTVDQLRRALAIPDGTGPRLRSLANRLGVTAADTVAEDRYDRRQLP